MDLGSVVAAWAHWPTDWIIIGAFAAIVALDTIRAGANRASALAIAFPIATILYSAIPQTFALNTIAQQFNAPIAQIALFAVLLVITYILIHRILSFYGASSSSAIPAIVTGLAVAAVVVVFWLQIPPLQSIWHFGPQVSAVFAESYRFFWILAAYAALAFARS